ncbi:MAG: dienelactone hydrolase family protein, partial [Beijerinckiaceae bacterium]|nr:dienelactone hydrolase family protein [Beijerinckiaceae bacterium]
LAYATAVNLPGVAAAVGYYGGGVAAMSDKKPQIPVMLHFGEKDHSISMADVEKVKANQPQVPVFVYPAGHGFNCDERASFDKESADLARSRTLAFFAEKLA